VSHWIPKQEEEWIFDIEDLRKMVRPNTKLIIINFPHNPTGATISQAQLNEIIEIAKEANAHIFSDEMYRYLEYDANDRLPSVSDKYEKAISLFGVSKTFSLAGLRVGWLTTQDDAVYEKLATFKDYTTICGSAPSEILTIMALRAKDMIIARNREIIQNNLLFLNDFFAKHTNIFSWNAPKAGTIGFPKLREDMNVADFCLDVVEKKGVLLLPANVYDFDGNNFRIGFGRRNMPEALSLFEKYLKEQ
jgi:aspartate/methionine/tyrosine aminotransferase